MKYVKRNLETALLYMGSEILPLSKKNLGSADRLPVKEIKKRV